MIKSLKDSIEAYSKEKNLSQASKLEKISSSWKAVVGKQIFNNTKVMFIKNNILFIKTRTPVWRTELELQKERIYNKLTEDPGQTTIKDIKFI